MRAAFCQDKITCRKPSCLKEKTVSIYGLYDIRLCDIFYVGSAFSPGQRFSEHLSGAREPYNCKSLWLQNILASGSYPLPILLYEFQSECETYTRQVEGDIARQLRADGHTAFWDAYLHPTYVDGSLPLFCPMNRHDWQRIARDREMALWAEHIDRIAEQARVTCMLQEMYLYG